jgi:hypothetical protein
MGRWPHTRAGRASSALDAARDLIQRAPDAGALSIDAGTPKIFEGVPLVYGKMGAQARQSRIKAHQVRLVQRTTCALCRLRATSPIIPSIMMRLECYAKT